MELSEGQIEKIAESIDAGFTCHINPDTGEVEETRDYGDDFNYIDDVDKEEYEEFLESEPEWQKEVRKEIKEQTARDSWERCIIIEKPDSSEAFRFMEDFVKEVIPEPEQKMYRKALQWKKPFANFNDLIHESKCLDNWYEFKKKKLMEYVREVLME